MLITDLVHVNKLLVIKWRFCDNYKLYDYFTTYQFKTFILWKVGSMLHLAS